MPEFEIGVSAYFTTEFDEKPTDDEVIAWLREDPHLMLSVLEVDSIDKVE